MTQTADLRILAISLSDWADRLCECGVCKDYWEIAFRVDLWGQIGFVIFLQKHQKCVKIKGMNIGKR